MNNLIQYASFLVAIGCELNFNSKTGDVEISEYPSEDYKKDAVTSAESDIELFLNTANFLDGMAVFHLCNNVDGVSNPISKEKRVSILGTLGIMKGKQFISSVLMQAKVNRSWHTSETPNTCSYFGSLCTHRGVNIEPKRRGIRSNRTPEQYHQKLESGIKREQFITPSLESAYALIPQSILTNGSQTVLSEEIYKQIEGLSPTELSDLVQKLTLLKSS